jgi:CMP-N-acetylneuraminic acid synthetase
MQSQDFPKRYRVNGAIYISEINKLKQKKSFFIDNSYAYIMDRNLSVDIDEDIDFILAESLSIKNEIN